MADPILQVVLHHAASLPDTPAVCALLCTSTAAAATVHKQLEGALHVKFCPTRLQQLAAWLQHHGSLLKSLDFEPCTPKPSLKPAAGRFSLSRSPPVPHLQQDNAPAAQALAEALCTATVAPTGAPTPGHGLNNLGRPSSSVKHLRSFRCTKPDAVFALPTPLCLLRALPTTLTQLELALGDLPATPDYIWALMLQQGLSRLKGLHELKLHNSSAVNFDWRFSAFIELQRALGDLPQLTSLHLSGFDSLEDLNNLQADSLQRLVVDNCLHRPLFLAHLSTLTELQNKTLTGFEGWGRNAAGLSTA